MAKRPAEDELSPLPPAKKARKYGPKRLYTVKVTWFTDDYKARGNDWAHSKVVGSFLSRKRANRCEEEELLKIVREKLEERPDKEKYALYWTKQEDADEKELDDEKIKEDLYELGAEFAEGDYVPNKFSVDIETTLFDDRASDEESLSSH
jgi:hypothetical protein